MRFAIALLCSPVKKIRSLLRQLMKSAPPSSLDPAEVVKANTKEAFEYFWSQDDFITSHYLEPDRLASYEFIAEYCVPLLTAFRRAGTLRVVDIGCGTGHMLQALKRRISSPPDMALWGVDFAMSAIRKARRLLPTATFMVGNLYASGLSTNSFDLVLCVETLEHVRESDKALNELVRICKPGGYVVVTVPNADKDSWDGHVNFWNRAQFLTLLSSYGRSELQLCQHETVLVGLIEKGLRAMSEEARPLSETAKP